MDMSWFYNILIIFGGLIISVLAFVDEIAEKVDFVKSIKSLWFKILMLIVGTVAIAVGTIRKDIEGNENTTKERETFAQQISAKDSLFRIERHYFDSIHQFKLQAIVDSSYSKSIKASNEALAKYNIVLIDSMRRVAGGNTLLAQLGIVAATPGSSPPVYVTNDNNSKIVNIKMNSSLATSYNISFKVYGISWLGENFVHHFVSPALGDNDLLVTNVDRTFRFPIPNNTIFNQEDDVFLVIIGTFSRDETAKYTTSFQTAIVFNFKDNKFLGAVSSFNFKKFKEYIKRNKL